MFSHQYTAAVERAALIDRSGQGKLSLTGADRTSFLHSLLTNDIASVKPGSGTYSAYLTPQGRMISDMRVEETGDEMLLDVEAAVADSLAERLDKLIFSEDVQVRNVTADFAEAGVHGPSAADVIERTLRVPAASLRSLKEYDNLKTPDGAVIVIRDDRFGAPGFDIYLPTPMKAAVFSSLIAAGATPIEDEVAETLRVESGRPKFLVDMDTDTIPLEAGLENRAISLTKGCYVGQEVIVRVLHRGHGRVAKKLVGLTVQGSIIPARGDAVYVSDQQVGRITSAAFSPRHGGPLALGYVQRDYAEAGTPVTIRHSGGDKSEAKVTQLGK